MTEISEGNATLTDVSAETPDAPARRTASGLAADTTYERLLGRDAWQRLAPEIRRRFSRRPCHNGAIEYRGRVRIHMSRAGRLFARVCQLFGNLLPPRTADAVPLAVRLTADPGGGVYWARRYDYADGPPVVVGSTKRVDGAGGLLELVGRYFVMELDVSESNGALVFVSTAYSLRLGRWRLRIPSLLTPGTTTVTHTQVAGDLFRFGLRVRHRWLGETLMQEGLFQGFDASHNVIRQRRRTSP